MRPALQFVWGRSADDRDTFTVEFLFCFCVQIPVRNYTPRWWPCPKGVEKNSRFKTSTLCQYTQILKFVCFRPVRWLVEYTYLSITIIGVTCMNDLLCKELKIDTSTVLHNFFMKVVDAQKRTPRANKWQWELFRASILCRANFPNEVNDLLDL